jgi:hypothetical protein
MTLAERVKAMPDEERHKFFRAMIEVSEAGRKAGASPQEWARMYVATHNEINQHLKETSND